MPAAVETLEPRILLSAAPPNVALTANPGVQQMPSVVADPLDLRHLVVAYMDRSLVNSGYAGIGVTVSRDGGGTWRHGSVSLPAGFGQGAAQPVVRFDGQGHVFVSFMAATFLGPAPPLTIPNVFNPGGEASDRALGFQSANGIFVARSDDGGLSWAPPVAVASHTYAGREVIFDVTPDLAIDTFARLPDGRPNPRYGTLYATWTRLYPSGQFPGHPDSTGGGDVMLAVSHDTGRTWRLQLRRDPDTGLDVTVLQGPFRNTTGFNQRPGSSIAEQSRLSVGPEGDLYQSDFGSGDFVVFHSADGGASFDGPDLAGERRVAFGPGLSSFPSADGLPGNHFRTPVVRQIVADPAHPGTVFAAEAIFTLDPTSNSTLDPADVYFARSADYGETWERVSAVGANGESRVLNDDNGGRPPDAADPDSITSGQALPKLATDEQGNVAVIWYDTRRDPRGHRLDVFGTASTDGGRTFAANFPVSDRPFDADAGVFTDAAGRDDYFLGDLVGLAAADGTAYAAWTDTRNGNQDVFFARYPIRPPPDAPDDRFEPNDAAPRATEVGAVVRRHLPKLALGPGGGDDWFRFTAAAAGQVTVSTRVAGDASRAVELELWDADGTTRLARGADVTDAAGAATGRRIMVPAASGETFLVRVADGGGGGVPARYALDLQSLSAEPDARVAGAFEGTLAAGGRHYYLLTAAAAGSVEVELGVGSGAAGRFKVELLGLDESADPDRLPVLGAGEAPGTAVPGGVLRAGAAVRQGQAVLVRVSGEGGAAGPFRLAFANLDPFATPRNGTAVLPDPAGPSKLAVGDLNRDGRPDLVVSNTLSGTVSVYLGNGDGTFQSPRPFDVGAFALSARGLFVQALPSFGRGVAIADVNRDGLPDVAVTNYSSADVSVLLGRGDGTFQPQRRADATTGPLAIDAGDLNGDGLADLLAMDSPAADEAALAVLLGRGDGTFRPQRVLGVPAAGGFPPGALRVADFNEDGRPDVAAAALNDGEVHVLLGAGDGTFSDRTFATDVNTTLAVADVDGDGHLDLAVCGVFGSVGVFLGRGDGTFRPFTTADDAAAGAGAAFVAGQVPLAIAAVDFGSQVQLPGGGLALGPVDGHPDLLIANSGISLGNQTVGPPEVVVLPALFGDAGDFVGFGAPRQLAPADAPIDLAAADFNGDGAPDVATVDRDGVRLIFGGNGGSRIPPNGTPATARNLGTVVHLLAPTLTVTPDRPDAYFALTVPTEAVGGGDEVFDMAAVFEHQGGPGLSAEVLDAATSAVLGSGSRLRVRVRQGQKLLLHVFGVAGPDGTRGTGSSTLDIDVLPQVASVEAQPLLQQSRNGRRDSPTAGPTSSLVLTFQGDRLDPASAQDASNYRVVWLGRDGKAGTRDDRTFAVDGGAVYNPGANVDVSTGKVYPTAVRQTVTLTFAGPLPAGSYRIELSPAIRAEAFSDEERALLSGDPAGGHPLVSLGGDGSSRQGAAFAARQLVPRAGPAAAGDFVRRWAAGTPFLGQLHDDLGALLDAALSAAGDQPGVTPALLAEIARRFGPAQASAVRAGVSLLVVFLDPVDADLVDPAGERVTYDLDGGALASGIPGAFVSVAGNVELIAVPVLAGLGAAPGGGDAVARYVLGVDRVQGTSRGGAVVVGPDGVTPLAFTQQMRDGQRQFDLDVPTADGNGIPPDRDPGATGLSIVPPVTAATFTALAGVAAATSVQTTAGPIPQAAPAPPPRADALADPAPWAGPLAAPLALVPASRPARVGRRKPGDRRRRRRAG